MSHRVLLLELTCPAEEGIEAAQAKKRAKYLELIENINLSGWSTELLTIEVGARGLVGDSTFKAFVRLG